MEATLCALVHTARPAHQLRPVNLALGQRLRGEFRSPRGLRVRAILMDGERAQQFLLHRTHRYRDLTQRRMQHLSAGVIATPGDSSTTLSDLPRPSGGILKWTPKGARLASSSALVKLLPAVTSRPDDVAA